MLPIVSGAFSASARQTGEIISKASDAQPAVPISTEAQLRSILNNLSGNYYLTQDIQVDSSRYWTPIGMGDVASFSGTLNGNGHVIRGLRIRPNSANTGLFSRNSGSIANLGLADLEAKGSGAVGGIAGVNTSVGSIVNCYVSGSIGLLDSDDAIRAGGIAGENDGVILNSHSEADVAGLEAGGIAGRNNGEISACYNTGYVSFSANVLGYGTTYVGGIAGQNNGKVNNCYNTGKIYAEYRYTTGHIGGLVGLNGGTVSKGYNTGSVSASSSKVGALIGSNNGILQSLYFLNTSCRDSVGDNPAHPQAVSRTEEQMKQQSAFPGFDFERVWNMESGGYPVLQAILFGAGGGSPSNPFQITTARELDYVRNYPSASFVLMNDITFNYEDFSQSGAFYNAGRGWLPLCSDGDFGTFEGNFDGAGHKIVGLQSRMGQSGAALFGSADGVIQNLTITGGWMSSDVLAAGFVCTGAPTIVNCANGNTISGGNIAAGILGSGNGKVENSCNTGTVMARCVDDAAAIYIGGIVGTGAGSVITGCYNTGRLDADKSWNTGKTFYVGGIAGEAGKIKDCYQSGIIHVNTNNNADLAYAGGIAGLTSSFTDPIQNCYSVANVQAYTENLSTCFTGGILGRGYAPLANCYYMDRAERAVGSGSGDAVSLSDGQMRQKRSFVKFDFEDVWEMPIEGDYPYPMLQSVPHAEAATAEILKITLTPPDKTVYQLGESLDMTGAYYTITYQDGKTEKVPVPPIDQRIEYANPGVHTIYQTFQNQSFQFTIRIVDTTAPRYVVQLEASGYDIYFPLGQAVTPEVYPVRALYSDGSEEENVSYTVSAHDPSKLGPQNVQISYGGKDRHIQFIWVEIVESAAIESNPSQAVFQSLWVGDAICFGGSENSQLQYTFETVSGDDIVRADGNMLNMVTQGSAKVKIQLRQQHGAKVLDEKTVTFTVSPRTSPEVITSSRDLRIGLGDTMPVVTLENAAYGSYYFCDGEAFQQAFWIPMGGGDFDLRQSDSRTIPVFDQMKESRKLDGNELTAVNTGVYQVNVVKISYSWSEDRAVDSLKLTIEEPRLNVSIPDRVTVGQTVDFITSLSGTSYRQMPIDEFEKLWGGEDEWDETPLHLANYTSKVEILSGGELLARSNGDYGSTLTSSESFTFTGEGVVRVKVTYEPLICGRLYSFDYCMDKLKTYSRILDIPVAGQTLSHIAVTPPVQTVYQEGQPISLAGMLVMAYDKDGTSRVVSDYTVSRFDESVGTQEITVSYQGLTDTFYIQVNPASVKAFVRVAQGVTAQDYLMSLLNRERYRVFKDGREQLGRQRLATGMQVAQYEQGAIVSSADIVVNGDVNGDGLLTAQDMILCKGYILEKCALENASQQAGDVNQDQRCDILDLIQMKRTLAGY